MRTLLLLAFFSCCLVSPSPSPLLVGLITQIVSGSVSVAPLDCRSFVFICCCVLSV